MGNTIKITTIEATIEERGNGFPDIGDYVPGHDGNLYRVKAFVGRIQTGRVSGAPNWCLAEVELADWDDCEEGEDFPGSVRLPPEDNDDQQEF